MHRALPMLAIAMAAVQAQSSVDAFPHITRDEPRAPLRSVQLERSHYRGMNAAQLAQLSRKNARRRKRSK